MSKVTDPLVLQIKAPAELATVGKILKAHFPSWELVGNRVYVNQVIQPLARVNGRFITTPLQPDLFRKLVELDRLTGGGTPLDIEVDITNQNNTVALMSIHLCSDDDDVQQISFTFRVSFVPKGKKANKVVTLNAVFTVTEVEAETPHVSAPLHIPGLASGAIGKELFDDVTQILRTDYPMWELEDGKVYISENYQGMVEAIVTYRAAHVPTGEIISFPINAHTLYQLLRRNYDSGVGIPVVEDFDLDNPNHKFSLLDIYICSDSETPQIGFIFQVTLVTRNSPMRKLVNLHALYPVLPSSLYVPTANTVKDDFEGDVLVGYLETTKPDSTWENLVAALLFSCTDYGTLEEFIINVKGSFFITPTVNVEGTTLVRTDSEMDDVVNMFQDVGYKHPDLLAIYHLIQYLRLTKDNKIVLASVSFNHPEKTSRYILSQPF